MAVSGTGRSLPCKFQRSIHWFFLSVAAETSLAECQQRPIRPVCCLLLYPASCSSVSSSEVSLSVKPSYLSLRFLFSALFLHFILFTAAMKSV